MYLLPSAILLQTVSRNAEKCNFHKMYSFKDHYIIIRVFDNISFNPALISQNFNLPLKFVSVNTL